MSSLVAFFEWSAGAPRRKTARVLALALGGVLWSHPGRALEYDYDAPASCPNREAFLSEVQSRLRYPAEQSSVETLRVTVRRLQGFEASFVLIEPGQPPVSRTLTAEACDEAVRALALGAALALDARYREVRGISEDMAEAPAPSVVPPAQATASSPAPAVAPSPAPAGGVAAVAQRPPASPALAPPAQPPPAPPVAVGPVDVDTPRPAPETVDAADVAMAVRLGAFAATGYSPDPSFGPSLGVLVQVERFALGLEAFVSSENRASGGGQSAEFWVVGGRLYPCLRWQLAGGVSARGCGVLEFSGVHAEGVESAEVVQTKADWVPYWALGAVAGAEAPLTGSIGLALDLGVQFPLTRREFYFSNIDDNLHDFPVVAARGQLAICYAF